MSKYLYKVNRGIIKCVYKYSIHFHLQFPSYISKCLRKCFLLNLGTFMLCILMLPLTLSSIFNTLQIDMLFRIINCISFSNPKIVLIFVFLLSSITDFFRFKFQIRLTYLILLTLFYSLASLKLYFSFRNETKIVSTTL